MVGSRAVVLAAAVLVATQVGRDSCPAYAQPPGRNPSSTTPEQAQLLRQAEQAVRDGDCHAALELHQSFLDRFPDSPALSWVYLRRGYAYLALKDRGAATAAFEEVARRFPEAREVPEALLRLGYCRLGSGNKTGAVEAFSRLASDHTQSPFAVEGAFRWGTTLLANGDVEGAAAAFLRLATELRQHGDPATDTCAQAARMLAGKGRTAEALALYAGAIVASRNAARLNEVTTAMARLGSESEVERAYQRIGVEPPAPWLRYHEGVAQAEAGQEQESLAVFSEVAASDTDWDFAACAKLRLGATTPPTRAAELCREALALAEGHGQRFVAARIALSTALTKGGEVREAQQEARAALAEAGTDTERFGAAETLAESLRGSAQAKDAVALVVDLVAKDPTPTSLEGLGRLVARVSAEDGEVVAQGKEALHRLTKLTPDQQADFWMAAGYALLAAGNRPEAERAFAEVTDGLASASRAAEALLRVGNLRIAGGDRAEACRLLVRALQSPSREKVAAEATERLAALLRAGEGDWPVAESAERLCADAGLPLVQRRALATAAGRLWARLDAAERGVELLEHLVGEAPQDESAPGLLLEAANLSFDANNLNTALRLAKQVADQYPACDAKLRVRAIMRQAYSLGHLKRFADAMALFDGLLKGPERLEPRVRVVVTADRAFYQGQSGAVDEAAQTLATCAREAADLNDVALAAELQRRAGMLLQDAGQYQRACDALRLVADRFGEGGAEAAGDALYRLADCCRALGEAAGEEEALDSLLARYPKHWRAAQAQARLAQVRSESEARQRLTALQALDAAALTAERKAERLTDLADLYLALGPPERAVAAIRELLRDCPESAEAPRLWLRLVALLREAGKPAEALQEASGLVNRHPDCPFAEIARQYLKDLRKAEPPGGGPAARGEGDQ